MSKEQTEQQQTEQKKKRMPAGAYIGGGLIGIAVLGFLFWCAAFLRVNALIDQGVGNVANYVLILSLYPIFFVGLPLFFGLWFLRRSRRKQDEVDASD